MFYRNKKSRKYSAPCSKVTDMALESNFCTTVRFNVQVKDFEVVNESTDEVLYFES